MLALIGGLATGEGAWRGAVMDRSSQSPPGWVLESSKVPYRLTELSGELAFHPDFWALDFRRTLRPQGPHRGPGPVSGRVRLPAEGQIELWAGLPLSAGAGGVGLILERIGEPSTVVVVTTASGRERVACSAPLPPPGEEALAASIRPTLSGVVATVGTTSVDCPVALSHAAPAVLPGLRRVGIADLQVDEQRIAGPGPGLRPLWWLAGGVAAVAVVAAELWMGASLAVILLSTLPLLLSLWMMGADLRLFVETARMAWVPTHLLPLLLPVGLTALVKSTHHLGRALRERPEPDGRDWPLPAAIAAGLPLGLALGSVPGWFGFIGGVAVGVGLAIAAGAALPRLIALLGSLLPTRSATAIIATATAIAGLLALTRPLHNVAILLSAGGGLCLGLLVWANANAARARAYNILCLVSLGLALLCGELALRYTPAGRMWASEGALTRENDIYGWLGNANQEFQLIQDARPTDYPDKGYPVRIPMREPGRRRVVAMGGSTTGGAYQNDNLNQFYPARMAELLGPSHQVLNQGVGGWTTWHIRRYLEDQLPAVDPDVLTLYVGHNDLLTPVPVPYAELYAAWRQGAANRGLSRSLNRLTLYQGLRYLLTAARPAGRRVAVPLSDAEENLRVVVEGVLGRGGQVILASEGLAPDPGPLVPYNQMMARLAAERPGQVLYVDVADRLHNWSGAEAYLDDCHLTETGHQIVAQALIEALGQLPSPARSP